MGNVGWNSGGSTDGNVAGNYNPARVPTGGDTWYGDATSVVNCIFSAGVSADGITVAAAHNAGAVDFGDTGLSHAFTADCTFDGTAASSVDCGDATITVQGDFDNKDQANWTIDSASFLFDGSNDQDVDGSGGSLGTWEINKSAGTVTATGAISCDSLTLVAGDLDFGGKTVTASGAIDFQSGSTVADLGDAVLNCTTLTADGVDLTSAGGYSDNVPDALSGQSLEFDGVGQYVDVPQNNDLEPGAGSFSMAGWVKADSLDYHYLFGTDSAAGQCMVMLNAAAGNKIAWYLRDPDNFDLLGGSFSAGTWLHIVVVIDRAANTAYLYVNGVEAATKDITAMGAVSPNSIFGIGHSPRWGLTYAHDGLLDDLRAYNDALTPDEVTYLHTDGDSGVDPTDTNLQLHLTLDGDCQDSSGNGNHGTLEGGAGAWTINASSSGSSVTNATIRNLTFNGPGGEKLDATVACVNGGNCSGVDFGGATGPLVNGGLVNGGLVNAGLVNGGLVGA